MGSLSIHTSAAVPTQAIMPRDVPERPTKRVKIDDDDPEPWKKHSIGQQPGPSLNHISPTQGAPALSLSKALGNFSVVTSFFRHQYTPLPDGHIRLAKVLPSEDSDAPLEIELISEPLDDMSTKYEAVSYTWGNPFPRYAAIVRDDLYSVREQIRSGASEKQRLRNNIRLAFNRRSTKFIRPMRLLRENLHNALMEFRRPRVPLYLWIDALCINQHDPIEKAAQIRLMGQIYGSAQHVRIWLGDKPKGNTITGDNVNSGTVDLAIAFIRDLADFETSNATLAGKSTVEALKWDALITLLRNRWFSRRWVIQEQAMAQIASLYYGDQKTGWNEFACAISILRRRKLDIMRMLRDLPCPNVAILDVLEGMGAVSMIRDNALVHPQEKKRSLEELVSDYTAFAASDPRDTVYAVVPIARHSQHACFDPDYGKGLLDVYCDFMLYAMDRDRHLDIIARPWAPIDTTVRCSVAEINNIGDKLSNYLEVETILPSWIKQLDRDAYGGPDSIMKGRKHGKVLATVRPFYDASRGAPDSSILFEFGKKSEDDLQDSTIQLQELHNGELKVRGIILGQVRRTSQRVSEGTIPREVLDMAGCSWIHEPRKSRNQDEVPGKLWRALVANQGPDLSRPPAYYRGACLFAIQRRNVSNDIITREIMEEAPVLVVEYLRKVQATIQNRRALIGGDTKTKTDKDLFGFGPEDMQEGDLIVVIYGCRVPVILRKVDGEKPFIGQRIKENPTSPTPSPTPEPSPALARSFTRPEPSPVLSRRTTRRTTLPIQPTTPTKKRKRGSLASPPASPPPSRKRAPRGPQLWRLIGDAYVDGFMDGEAIEDTNRRASAQEFVLI